MAVGSTEAIRDWFNASIYNKEEIDRFFIQNNQQDLIPYELWIKSNKPCGFVKLVGKTSGKEYTVYLNPEIIEDTSYKKDSVYYVEDTNNFFKISYRNYRKKVAGPAYGTKCYYGNSSTSPMFVSQDPEFVKYTTSDGGSFSSRATCEYRRKTWYVAGGSYGFSGNFTGDPYFVPTDPSANDWGVWGLDFLKHIYES